MQNAFRMHNDTVQNFKSTTFRSFRYVSSPIIIYYFTGEIRTTEKAHCNNYKTFPEQRRIRLGVSSMSGQVANLNKKKKKVLFFY